MNPPKERIANRQLFYFLFMMRTTIVIATLPVLTAADALQDAWISSILSFFSAAILVVMIGALSIRFPELTVVQYSQKLLGTWGGRIFSLLFILNYLHIASTDVRIYAEAIITGFLPTTPLVFIISVMVVVAGLAAHAGVEVIGRAADLLFPFFGAMIALALVLPLPEMRLLLGNLEPIMGRGLAPVLRGALVPTLIIAQYLSLLMLTPTTTQPVKALKTALCALAASSFVLTLVAGGVIVMLGPDRGSRSTFPFFAMVRTIQISDFIERVEILAVFSWGFGLFIGLSVFLLVATWGLSQVLGLSTYRPLIGPIMVICVALAAHSYRDMFQIRSFFSPPVMVPIQTFAIVVPMGILWLAYLYRRWLGRE